MQSKVTDKNVTYYLGMTSDELRSLLIAHGLTNFDVQRLISLAANADGSATHGRNCQKSFMIFADVDSLAWDVRIRDGYRRGAH